MAVVFAAVAAKSAAATASLVRCGACGGGSVSHVTVLHSLGTVALFAERIRVKKIKTE